MIVAVCSDKGSPGVTTLATALGAVWPGRKVLIEADPSGADLPFRLRQAQSNQLLDSARNVLDLAAAARTGLGTDGPLRFAQLTSLGVAVIPGALRAEAFSPMSTLWPQMAQEVARWQGTALVDVGRMQPGNPAAAMVRAADLVLYLATPTLSGLYRLRDRVGALVQIAGEPGAERSRVAVVVRASEDVRREAAEVAQVLSSVGSPVQVAGVIANDPGTAAALGGENLPRRLAKSALMRSSEALVSTLVQWWPTLVTDVQVDEPARAADPAVIADATTNTAARP